MHFIFTADTDIGISKKVNQDSVLIKHGQCLLGEVLMAIICDGMGGLEKGELASAVVVRAFDRWFEEEFPYELEHLDLRVIGEKWALLLKDLNVKLSGYAQKQNITLGTTFTGILFVQEEYVVVHIGDTRVYQIGKKMTQLTEDQTFVAQEIKKGTMTVEQAKTDKRRNMLLQCVGASDELEPQIFMGNSKKGAYMLCSDGFRHEISEEEMYQSLRPESLKQEKTMHTKAKNLMKLVKQRKEKDNITVILIKVS